MSWSVDPMHAQVEVSAKHMGIGPRLDVAGGILQGWQGSCERILPDLAETSQQAGAGPGQQSGNADRLIRRYAFDEINAAAHDAAAARTIKPVLILPT